MNEFEETYNSELDKPAETQNTLQKYENVTKQDNEKKFFSYKKDTIEPLDVDPTEFDRTNKSFFTYAQDELTISMLEKLDRVSDKLNELDFTLRLSHDNENQLEKIFKSRVTKAENYLPFKNYNEVEVGEVLWPTEKAHRIACKIDIDIVKQINKFKKIEKSDETLKEEYQLKRPGIKLFGSQKVHLLLGKDCKTPVSFILIYTDCGSETTEKVDYKKTKRALYFIQQSEKWNIPLFNLKKPDAEDRLIEYLKTFN